MKRSRQNSFMLTGLTGLLATGLVSSAAAVSEPATSAPAAVAPASAPGPGPATAPTQTTTSKPKTLKPIRSQATGRTTPGLVGEMPMPPADRILRAQSEALFDDPAALFRAAEESIAQDDDAHADWIYGQLAKRHPIVGDHAGLRRARLQFSKGRAAEAEQIAAQTLATYRESPLRSELHALIGEARIAERDETGAREAWAAALSETNEDDQRAALLRKVARSEERSGEDLAAGVTWRLLWYSHPNKEEAEQASHRLDVIEAHLGKTLRRAADWRRRGDRLFRLRMNDEALEAYDKALAMGLSPSEKRRSQKQRAQTLFRLRRYPLAVEAFESLPKTGDNPIWVARSKARADRVPEAIASLQKIAKKKGPHSIRAHYLAALLLDGRDRIDEARVHFNVLANDPMKGGMARTALWNLGWSEYRQGRYVAAADRFEKLAEITTSQIDRLRPMYWRARSLEAAERTTEAETLYRSLAEQYPLSYYGWRARARRNEENVPLAAPSARVADAFPKGKQGLQPNDLARVRILMEAGLVEDGASETGRLTRRAKGLDDRIELARLLTSAGDYNRAQKVVVNAYTTPLAKGPVSGLEEVWWYAWPSAYQGFVDSATGEEGSVDPELVYSIMREESGYRPKVISPVGARGLLQIMRETGKALADRSGRGGFDPDDLFDPRTNIELGSFYLGELSRQFPTKLSASIASYNAGPHVVENWVDKDARPDDEWVESIPYSQTRSYVKRVMRSLQAYRLLY
ncbi:MAG: transglycosylase SLT domain-containing protein [Myxococcota bacterium]